MPQSQTSNKRDQAWNFVTNQAYDKALPIFEELIEAGDADSNVYYLMGQCHRFLNNMGAAVDCLEKAELVAFSENHSGDAYLENLCTIQHALGIALQLSESYDEAIEIFEKAATTGILQKKTSTLNSMGLTYKIMGKYSEALQKYNDAMGCHLAYIQGKIKAETGSDPIQTRDEGDTRHMHFGKEFELIPQFLKQDVMYSMIMNNIGCIYLETGKFDEAKEQFAEAIEFIPDGYNYPDPHENFHIASSKASETE